MEKRRLGRTGHMSTIGIFGSVALRVSTQAEADAVMEMAIEAGVNHIDISPRYGLAEERVGPWMPRERDRFFLGCKTILRTKEEAAEGLRRSLETLQTDRFDLFQLHEVVSMEELDKVTAPGGPLDGFSNSIDEMPLIVETRPRRSAITSSIDRSRSLRSTTLTTTCPTLLRIAHPLCP